MTEDSTAAATPPAPSPAAPPLPFALVSGVVVRPGDVLVVATPATGAHWQADVLRTRIAAQLPGVEVVVLTGVSGLAAYCTPAPPQVAISGGGADSSSPSPAAREAAHDE